jgi:putative spermidine/putrescine transport system permease protein
MLIYVYFQVPVAILVLLPAFEKIKSEWMESAQLLGATKLKFWATVGLPVILPSIAGTFCFLFANSMSAYATAYALVGSNYSLLTVQIASMFTGDVFPRYGLGSALSIIMIVLISIAVYFNSRLIAGREKYHEKA